MEAGGSAYPVEPTGFDPIYGGPDLGDSDRDRKRLPAPSFSGLT